MWQLVSSYLHEMKAAHRASRYLSRCVDVKSRSADNGKNVTFFRQVDSLSTFDAIFDLVVINFIVILCNNYFKKLDSFTIKNNSSELLKDQAFWYIFQIKWIKLIELIPNLFNNVDHFLKWQFLRKSTQFSLVDRNVGTKLIKSCKNWLDSESYWILSRLMLSAA